MKLEVRTTITTEVDPETMELAHFVSIEAGPGIPESIASAAALNSARSLIKELGLKDGRTLLAVPSDQLKMLREALCRAQAALDEGEDLLRLGMLIEAIDRERPLGPDGKHGDRHTMTCGCEDK